MGNYKKNKHIKSNDLKKRKIWNSSFKDICSQTLYTFMPMLVSIVVSVTVLFLSHLSPVKNILDNDINTINMLIGVISLILSCFSVYYGRKAYRVAQDIFEKGIQINKKKILDEISWEFASDFFIPLSRFYAVAETYVPKSNGKYCPLDNPVEDIYNEIKKIKMPDRFSYWELHKRDVFDALNVDGKQVDKKIDNENQNKAFSHICEFIDKAMKLQTKINRIIEALNQNRTIIKDGRCKKVRLDELFDRRDQYGKISNELDELFNQMETLMQYKNTLPEELDIKNTILLLKNNDSIEVIQ